MLFLYDLAGADPACRFSPYCWRIRMALGLKGLPYETVPMRFTDKALLAFSGQDKVPVLVDGARVVTDSGAIAAHLDEAFPDTPVLLGEGRGAALTAFVRHWTEGVLHPRVLPLILLDVLARLSPADQAYFRQSREARFGRTLEDVAAEPEAARTALRAALAPLRATLGSQPFLAGMAPAYADCIVFGAFQWARTTSPRPLLDGADPVAAWLERMLDAGDGAGRAAPAAAG